MFPGFLSSGSTYICRGVPLVCLHLERKALFIDLALRFRPLTCRARNVSPRSARPSRHHRPSHPRRIGVEKGVDPVRRCTEYWWRRQKRPHIRRAARARARSYFIFLFAREPEKCVIWHCAAAAISLDSFGNSDC